MALSRAMLMPGVPCATQMHVPRAITRGLACISLAEWRGLVSISLAEQLPDLPLDLVCPSLGSARWTGVRVGRATVEQTRIQTQLSK